MATIVYFTDVGNDFGLCTFILSLAFILFSIALLKYLDSCFIRSRKPVLTVKLFTEIIVAIINKYNDKFAFGLQPQERKLWRHKIYEVCDRHIDIFFPAKEFSPELIVPFADPDEYDLPLMIDECAEVMSLSFETVDQSGIYTKYLDYDEDEILTIVRFADILIDFWAENKKIEMKQV